MKKEEEACIWERQCRKRVSRGKSASQSMPPQCEKIYAEYAIFATDRHPAEHIYAAVIAVKMLC